MPVMDKAISIRKALGWPKTSESIEATLDIELLEELGAKSVTEARAVYFVGPVTLMRIARRLYEYGLLGEADPSWRILAMVMGLIPAEEAIDE